jgi:hypothetical protein
MDENHPSIEEKDPSIAEFQSGPKPATSQFEEFTYAFLD